jgi:hypothetical protein
MKQQHINLLRAAANLLQSSQIQDENISELKKQITLELRKKNISKVDILKEQVEFAKQRNKKFLSEYADTIQQLAENDFTKLLNELLSDDVILENPVFFQHEKSLATI